MCSGSKSFIRNAAMQAELYAIGRRGIPDEVTVTICDGINSKSNHQSGQAMDITIIGEKGDVIYDEIAYKKLADFWKSLDPKARWGGDFTPREIWHYDLLA
jgi:D-alanyl-D-alanine dipeptidase